MKTANIKRGAKSNGPVYKPMVEALRECIDNGTLKEGQQIPSELELANQYRISRSSVRQGLGQLLNLGKIRKISGKGTFVRGHNLSANLLSTNLSHKTVSFLAPSVGDPFVSKVYAGIAHVLKSAGYSLNMCSSENTAAVERVNLHQCMERGSSGLIILPLWGLESAPEIEALHDRGVPLVLVDRTMPNYSIDCVSTDNFRGGFLAAEHLVQMGHRRIGMIRGIANSANNDRYKGYCSALAKYEILLDDSLVILQEYHDHEHEPTAGGKHEMEILMSLPDRPTAIFACNDGLALGAEKTAFEMGLKIPDDVSIIGFDDLQYARLALVPLTTIHQPAFEIGQSAAELLLESTKVLMTAGAKHKSHKIEFTPKLVVRQSVCSI